MATDQSGKTQKTCFVIMGFGKKTDFETGRTLDLDRSYQDMIKPAVEEAGLRCIRADEIVHSGLIDVPMYDQLLNADVVIADLSTGNKNAFYELGVRHALRPYTTLVIAEDGIKSFPFDVNRVLIRQYRHLGEGISYNEVIRFRKLLTDAIREILAKSPSPKDSPVYTFLDDLTPPIRKAVEEAMRGAMPYSLSAASATRSAGPVPDSEQTHSMLMRQVDEAQKRKDFVTAKALLGLVRHTAQTDGPERPENPYILQRLALVTYKSKHPSEREALREAREILSGLAPATSHDTETLGLWGAVHKRLWELDGDPADLDQAVRSYRRGFYLRNDYYNGINLAFLLNVRAAAAAEPAEAIADFVQARRVRKEVLDLCDAWLAENPEPDAAAADARLLEEYRKNRYWVLATRAEALLGLGDPQGQERLDAAYAQAPEGWMADSTREQIGKLTPLLADSPLRHL